MAAGVDIDFTSNPWVITFNGSTATHTLPFQIWPFAGYAGPVSPCIVQRWIWIAGDSAMAGNKVVMTDVNASAHEFLRMIATGADYEPPQEWKRQRNEGAPYGAIITIFDAGKLYAHL